MPRRKPDAAKKPAPFGRSCHGKKAFGSWSKANEAMKQVLRHAPDDGRMHPYRCRHCQGWHFGHERGG